MKQYLRYLFVVNAILFIILLSFTIHVFNKEFYSHKFEENGAYATFGKDKIDKVNSEVFGFFLLKNNLETGFFNEKEKEHLKDVRTLFIKGYVLLFISFFILVALYKQWAFKLFLASGLAGLLIILIITLLSFINFNFLFTLFHKIFFKDGTWIFDSGIIQVYTYDLFYNMFLRILITSVIFFIALISLFFIKNKLKY